MAEDPTTDPTTDPADGDRPLAGAALKSALEKERKDRKTLEKTVSDLQKRLDDADAEKETAKRAAADANKSEMDKLREQVEQLAGERDRERSARESAEQDRERVARVRKHAGDFADADDVVDLLRGRGELDAITDDDTAQRVLAELKRDKPHLLKQADASGFEQVLRNGQPITGTEKDAGPTVTPEQLVQMNPEQLAALKTQNPAAYWKALEQAGQVETSAYRSRHVAAV